MTDKVKAVPEGYHTATPYLTIRNAAQALDFYKRAFGATEVMRMADPNGKVGHAEIRIGDSAIMLSDEFPDMDARSPQLIGGTPVMIHLYVEDADELVKRAVEAGATLQRPVENQFYGDRAGKVADPFGHIWWIATHVEDVPPQEIEKRAAAMFASPAG
ncbi:MAG TPA: VOC family protein [Noviherbaspirillum sp.]|nr:VOC family protein [Noviherbaspirillum sp.]